jgi:thioredoxin-like negative regulator of GroEL
VQLEFKVSCRQTDFKGPGKLACQRIVQKQYKTALNHLLKIDNAKKELASTVRKTIAREVQKLCNDKDSVFRGFNIKNFS